MAQQRSGIETLVERRRAPRAPIVVRVEYATVDALFSDFTRDINEGGLFIETDDPAALDADVTLQFSLPGSDEPIKVAGRVTRVSRGGAGEPAGIGVEFGSLDPEARARINDLVLALRTRS